jgi:hypothetical protein
VFFKSIDGAPSENRDIRGHLLILHRGKGFTRINTQKSMCDPMTYPLLFPNGDHGWDQNLKRRNPDDEQEDTQNINQEELQFMEEEARIAEFENANNTVVNDPEPEIEEDIDPDDSVRISDVNRRGSRLRITQCEFYSNKLSIRKGIFNGCLYGGPLTQQFIVDSYTKIEANRLNYLETHQKYLHVTQYNGLMDYISTRAAEDNITVGTPVILPSSFTGSPRAMKQGYQDAMAICGRFGKPTFFLTFTCNPK